MSRWSMQSTVIIAVSGLIALGTACGGKSDDEIEAEVGAQKKAAAGQATAKAKDIFSTRCTPCHGPEGKGDGPTSATLDPKPRNFQDAAWQKSVTDDHIVTIIKSGGAAVGKSAAMPSNPDITDKAVLAALKDHVRSLAKP